MTLHRDIPLALATLSVSFAVGTGCGPSECIEDCGADTDTPADATATSAQETATEASTATPADDATAAPEDTATPAAPTSPAAETPDAETPTPEAPTATPEASARLSATLETNPGCDLSAIVRWTTDAPATSWVEFGEGALSHRIGSDSLTTSHEVVVVGMTPEAAFKLQAVSTDEGGAALRSSMMDFTTGALPYAYMQVSADRLDASKSAGGWTLYNVATDNMNTPVVLEMVNEAGAPVWYYVHDGGNGRLDAQTTWVDGTVLFGPAVAQGDRIFRIDLTGTTVWEGPEQQGDKLDESGTYHHITEPVEGGGILTVQLQAEQVEGVTVMSDTLYQYDADGNVVWSWRAIEHTDQIPLDVDTLDPKGDWLHINSAALALDEGVVYVSSLKLQQVLKIDRATGKILWKLGSGGDFAADPSAQYPWFALLHAIEYLGDGRFILYDNGSANRHASRAVMYSLDEDAMEATIEWSFSGDDGSWFNNVGGDADLLSNGNVLIVGGSGMSGSTDTRLMEVTPDGEIVWRVWPYQGNDVSVSVFQADRIPALAEAL